MKTKQWIFSENPWEKKRKNKIILFLKSNSFFPLGQSSKKTFSLGSFHL